MLRRVNISAAFIVIICFFLPWEQVSCAGAKDNLSGFDLARHDQTLLYLIPLLMLAVIVVGIIRRQHERPGLLGIVGLISGSATTWLMNSQRARVEDAALIISAQMTGWFWLGFLSAVTVVITALARLFIRPRAT